MKAIRIVRAHLRMVSALSSRMKRTSNHHRTQQVSTSTRGLVIVNLRRITTIRRRRKAHKKTLSVSKERKDRAKARLKWSI